MIIFYLFLTSILMLYCYFRTYFC